MRRWTHRWSEVRGERVDSSLERVLRGLQVGDAKRGRNVAQNMTQHVAQMWLKI